LRLRHEGVAQPITWGLAAGTPLSVAFALFMVLKK
jgi:hypothetical protein